LVSRQNPIKRRPVKDTPDFADGILRGRCIFYWPDATDTQADKMKGTLQAIELMH